MVAEVRNRVAQTGEITQDDVRLLEVMKDLDDAPEPALAGSTVLEKGDEASMTPTILTSDPWDKQNTLTKSAGYVWLRRNSDGKLRQVSKLQLGVYLRMRLQDGRRAWLSPKEPWNGKVREPNELCPLHPQSPDRAFMDELNLEVCTKRGKLMGKPAVRRHLLRKHKDAFDAIQKAEEDRRQSKRDASSERLSEALQAMIARQGSSTERTPAKTAPKVTAEDDNAILVSKQCDQCAEVFEAKNALGASAKLRAHKTKAHRE